MTVCFKSVNSSSGFVVEAVYVVVPMYVQYSRNVIVSLLPPADQLQVICQRFG